MNDVIRGGQIDKAVNCRRPKRRARTPPRCQRTNSATALSGEPGARAANFSQEADIWGAAGKGAMRTGLLLTLLAGSFARGPESPFDRQFNE